MKRITRLPVDAILLDHLGAEDVGRHQVGRELDAVELAGGPPAASVLMSSVFARPGHAAQQAVTAGEERDQNLANDALLADDRLGELGFEPPATRRPARAHAAI